MLHYDKEVQLYDVDKRIIAVWNYLIHATSHDIISLPMFGPGTNIDQFSLSQPEAWFLGYMISSSTRNPKKTATERTNWDERSRKRIAESVGKVKHWKADVLDFRLIPAQAATWFIDPPYQVEGRWYDNRLKQPDYAELLNLIENVWTGQRIVCENDGATWADFRPLVVNKGQSGNKKMEMVRYYE